VLFKFVATTTIGGILAIAAFSGPVYAETTTPAEVSCLQVPAKMADKDIQSFLDNPKAILATYPTGGLAMSGDVRSLAGSSSHALQAIMSLMKDANKDQKSAIASGLARAAYVCNGLGQTPAQNYAADIQAAVANAGDVDFASAFQSASNDISVASTGPGGPSSTAGGGATTDTSDATDPNGYKSPGDQPIDTTSGNYTFGNVDPFIDQTQHTSPSGS
jgi:hypothetical protein